ncbi:maleylpyruvate isomerase family mycothiol-dependent enzyme [Micromonospora sp. HNM0581]|uniref:maleylpyruvate isomerase family mycothiol-dependent enzyme n=1 Tax=Micromonospora sp. HNM0581 TaxID=2716341 RepID=UPI00146B2412|nr:maleylpyruvate isomerase family mycothiol-dependent enzyme [Micromonospora sp. HNM0581]NLU79170.1 maleylpyruvate isomerase family mycothiol-dependent enzyme [Micromonospora sp. HNM0581]
MTVTEPHVGATSNDRADVAYRQVRRNTAALLADPAADPDRPVPHCPGWSLADLVAHLVEVCARVHARIGGTEPAASTPDDVPVLLAEWEQLSPLVENYLAEPGSVDRYIVVMDAFTHELDLRQALGVQPPDDHPALATAMTVLTTGLARSLDGHGLPPLEVATRHGRWVLGAGRPATTVTGPWSEVYLSLAGRRTETQIRSLRWSADPSRWLPAFTWGPFRVPAEPSGAPGSP